MQLHRGIHAYKLDCQGEAGGIDEFAEPVVPGQPMATGSEAHNLGNLLRLDPVSHEPELQNLAHPLVFRTQYLGLDPCLCINESVERRAGRLLFEAAVVDRR